MRTRAAILAVVATWLGSAAVAALPPSPYRLLASRAAESPPLEALLHCDPPGAPPALRQALADAEHGELERALADLDAIELRACASLVLARLELAARRFPEAAVHAARARRRADALPEPLDRLARFAQAEARRPLDPASAEAIYSELAAGDDALSRAAKLRLLERALEADPQSDARSQLELEIESGAIPGATPARFGPWLAERAIAARDLEAARRSLARSDLRALGRAQGALVEIRRADVLAALGRGGEASAALRAVAARHAGEAVAALANVRLVASGLGDFADEEAERRVARAAARSEHGLSLYARGVLASVQLRAGRFAAALETLTRLLHAAPPEDLVPHLARDVHAALEAAVASDLALADRDGACARLWARLGGRRALFLRHAPEPAPLLALGDCGLHLGLASPAIELYRALSRRFGSALAGELSERLARASLAAGELAAARARAEALLRQAEREDDAVARARWQHLLAQVAFASGDPALSAALLAPPLRERALPEPERAFALRLFARALQRAGADASARTTLRDALARSAADGAGEAEDEDSERRRALAEAALVAANLERRAGAPRRARALAARASSQLEPGPLRAQAARWEARLSPDLDAARAAWRRAAQADASDPWARLAGEELGISRLREAVGAPPPAIETESGS